MEEILFFINIFYKKKNKIFEQYSFNNNIKILNSGFLKFALFFIIFFFLIIYVKNNEIILKFIITVQDIKSYFEFQKLENYLQLCNNMNIAKINNIKKYKEINNPEISIISPIFNRERYLRRFLNSIHSQSFYSIEIVLIDDCSKDNSVKYIKDHSKNDNRIKIITNKKNKGTFINRNIAVLFSKGKYIIFPDPDDILYKKVLNFCYKFAEKYNYEMIRFNLYMGKKDISFGNIIKEMKNRPIYQPELSTYSFYGNNELQIIDLCLINKFINLLIYFIKF